MTVVVYRKRLKEVSPFNYAQGRYPTLFDEAEKDGPPGFVAGGTDGRTQLLSAADEGLLSRWGGGVGGAEDEHVGGIVSEGNTFALEREDDASA